MATKTFTINLNGGDIETPNIDLIFKIYGSANGYTTAIATLSEVTTPTQVSLSGDILTLLNVEIGTENTFKVGCVDADGNESDLSDAYTTVPSNPITIGVLSQGTVTSTSIQLNWTAATSTAGSITYYDIYKDEGTSSYDQTTGNFLTYTATYQVTPGSTILWRIKARDNAGNTSEFSNQISVTTPL